MNQYDYVFTVFTPTYNRVHTLHRVYESLQRQTYRNFEWLIVDDGSTDKTKDIISEWQKEGNLSIRYIWQSNQGKHAAFNTGVTEAKGELFLTLDSDDGCMPNSLERFKWHWDCIPADLKNHFSAVTALCQDQSGNIIGNRFPMDVIDSDSLEIRYKYGLKGEKWGFQRTEVLKRFPFPTIENERFIPEGIVWNAIARTYKTRFINEPLRIYWIDASGKSDQITKSSPGKHAIGHALWHQTILNYNSKWFRYSPKDFIKSAIHYARFSFHAKKSLVDQLQSLSSPLGKLLWIAACWLGYLVYIKDIKESLRSSEGSG